jgi:hypothetical protein
LTTVHLPCFPCAILTCCFRMERDHHTATRPPVSSQRASAAGLVGSSTPRLIAPRWVRPGCGCRRGSELGHGDEVHQASVVGAGGCRLTPCNEYVCWWRLPQLLESAEGGVP